MGLQPWERNTTARHAVWARCLALTLHPPLGARSKGHPQRSQPHFPSPPAHPLSLFPFSPAVNAHPAERATSPHGGSPLRPGPPHPTYPPHHSSRPLVPGAANLGKSQPTTRTSVRGRCASFTGSHTYPRGSKGPKAKAAAAAAARAAAATPHLHPHCSCKLPHLPACSAASRRGQVRPRAAAATAAAAGVRLSTTSAAAYPPRPQHPAQPGQGDAQATPQQHATQPDPPQLLQQVNAVLSAPPASQSSPPTGLGSVAGGKSSHAHPNPGRNQPHPGGSGMALPWKAPAQPAAKATTPATGTAASKPAADSGSTTRPPGPPLRRSEKPLHGVQPLHGQASHLHSNVGCSGS